jgi:hypothetical protein
VGPARETTAVQSSGDFVSVKGQEAPPDTFGNERVRRAPAAWRTSVPRSCCWQVSQPSPDPAAPSRFPGESPAPARDVSKLRLEPTFCGYVSYDLARLHPHRSPNRSIKKAAFVDHAATQRRAPTVRPAGYPVPRELKSFPPTRGSSYTRVQLSQRVNDARLDGR